MSETISLSRRRLRTWIRLLRLTRRSESHLREFLRVNHDTTLPRFDVMAALHRNEAPMKMSELSRMLLVSNGNATTVITRLEQDGWVVRTPVKTDRRVIEVQMTDQGRAEFEVLAAAHEAEVDKLFADLGHDELDALRDLLQRARGDDDDTDE
ncbi:MarR family transcriptional regulator [Sedimentitalea sp. CY04]|uniref:MarR family transcriptional regulator n=1 Tax=Parasedimentitalea denitrificans TaxID=2211118 RepID=A0ABX0W2B2_9RHOB|nr:MarR family transcriptional regulator [Sedimentitalea sp. CY04]NIZ59771.1 MarR family transcriptional regulator [Sedimentitalea sp. CY04]